MRKYCKNCIYCKLRSQNWKWCEVHLLPQNNIPEFVQNISQPFENHTQEEFNLDGDCPHYVKRKWYQFNF